MSRLSDHYHNQVMSDLQSQFGIQNVHQTPQLEKIVLNVGAGRAIQDSRMLDTAVNTLRKITGQQPVKTVAKHSVAGFKLRQGQPIGAKVTLRGDRMYEFLDRLITVVLPRTRDFRGLSGASFDPDGNYSLGIADQSVFPELSYEDCQLTHGMQVNIITNSNAEQSYALLSAFGLPFERSNRG